MAESNDKPWLDGVEGEPGRRLIECEKQYIQVVAGPGAGKTFGLKRRVTRLVKAQGVKQSSIFVGTFTRAIRDELAAALAPAVPEPGDNDRVHVETLHSHAYGMLRDHPASHPGREFRFLLEHEEAAMLYDLKDAAPNLDFYKRRDEMRKVESYWSGSGALEDDKFRGAMVGWLEQHKAMHVNEVVYLALNALESGDLPSGTYAHVVVDEYQDLTSAEQQLVEKLRGDDGCLMVLGDDDQSIYGFRYNHPGGITEFPNHKDPTKLESIAIEENRRCGDIIVDIANRLMAAAGSKKKPMVPKRGETGVVDVIHWPTLENEIDGISAYVKAKTDTAFLILVTRRKNGYRLRDKIGEEAWTSFHEEVLRTDLVRERFALASLLANEDDAVALRAWFGFSANGPEAAPGRNAEAVKSLAGSGFKGRALIDAINEGTVRPVGRGQKAVKHRASDYAQRSKETAGLHLDEAIRYLFDPALANAIDDNEDQRYASDDLDLLREAALQIAHHQKDPSLLRVVDTLRYRISTRQPLLEVEPDVRVRIMTLHGAKGLEADSIIIAGLADQILPGKDIPDPKKAEEHRDEQRRLLYVAITRAKKHLVISRPKTITYADAMDQNVRIDKKSIFTDPSGVKVVGLSACRFLPSGIAATDGREWLRKDGII